MTKIEIKRPGESSTIELKTSYTSLIASSHTKKNKKKIFFCASLVAPVCRAGFIVEYFGSNLYWQILVNFLVCGRCYSNNLSLKIALPARVNKSRAWIRWQGLSGLLWSGLRICKEFIQSWQL